MSDANVVCCLCGKPATDKDPITREHVPPKQFYPKPLRDGLNLWVVPTHKSCNNQHKANEEYFYHALYPLVANVNPQTAGVILDDLKRRAKKPQTPTLLRSILKTSRTTTEGGIVLPPGVVRLDADKHRLQQVASKIGRCLFYREHKRVMPQLNCKDIRLCEREEDVPELYTLSWAPSPAPPSYPTSETAGRPFGIANYFFLRSNSCITSGRERVLNTSSLPNQPRRATSTPNR